MRTKTLLITAALTAAGALSSMAQVYSVNIVGYVNLNIPGNGSFSMIANQLNNGLTPQNQIKDLLPAPPDKTTIYKYDPVAGYSSEQYDAGLGQWTSLGVTTINPGEGAFIFAATAFTATFVGEVQLSSTVNFGNPPGSFAIASSVIPQAGYLHLGPTAPPPVDGNPDLGLTPTDKETIYLYDPVAGYSSYSWDAGLNGWGGDPTAAGPEVAVGQAFFNFSATASSWTRTFVVGPP